MNTNVPKPIMILQKQAVCTDFIRCYARFKSIITIHNTDHSKKYDWDTNLVENWDSDKKLYYRLQYAPRIYLQNRHFQACVYNDQVINDILLVYTTKIQPLLTYPLRTPFVKLALSGA